MEGGEKTFKILCVTKPDRNTLVSTFLGCTGVITLQTTPRQVGNCIKYKLYNETANKCASVIQNHIIRKK